MCSPRVCLSGLGAFALLLGCGSPAANDFGAAVASLGGSTGSGGVASGGASGGTSKGGGGGAAGGPDIGDTGTFGAGEEPIDDMEDGNAQIDLYAGRDGFWYVISDMTSGAMTQPAVGATYTMVTNEPPRGASVLSAGLGGGNFADWGAGLVFNFRASIGETVPPYDASAYTGLSFYGRSLVGPLDVRVTVPDSSSHPAGGICSAENCYNHYHSDVTLDSRWRKYTIPFSSLIKDGSTGGSFNETVVFAVEFVVPAGALFEFLIDDIAFTEQ